MALGGKDKKIKKIGIKLKDSFSGMDAVKTRPIFDSGFATKIVPKDPGMKLGDWYSLNKVEVESLLYETGAVLFRGFNVDNDEDFSDYLKNTGYEFLDYLERSSPRFEISGKVYTSTSYPREQEIFLHNENTASIRFASKVWFYCNNPADSGGQTPIGSSADILNRIDNDVAEKFVKLGWKLVRNYNQYVAYDWKSGFGGLSKKSVEQYCRDNRIDYEWTNSGDLKTTQIRSSIIIHPFSRKKCWFNHVAFWHTANLDEFVYSSMLQDFGEEGLPFMVSYGDGTAIPDEIAKHLKEAYLTEKRKFDWMEGDVLMLDNILSVHGRESYAGDRRIRVALADPFVRPKFTPDI